MSNIQKSTKRQLNNPFTALKHPNFRYYWFGMCISLIGTWMQNIAQPWLAYSLTKSPFLLSLVGTLQFLPVLLFSLFAGVVIDRLPKRAILLFTQSASLIITFALAILVGTHTVEYWHILVAASVLGIVNAMDMPTRQAFVIELVGKDDLMNAIALNSSVFNIARVIGPALAGIVMGYGGEAACFYINAISFAAVIVSLLFIKPLHTAPNRDKKPAETSMFKEIWEGIRYIYQNKVLYRTLLVVAVIGTFGMNFSVLVPVFAKEVLGEQETGFGFLMAFLGVGSFCGAMLIATMSGAGPQKKVLKLFPYIIAALLIWIGFTSHYWVTGISLAACGLFFVAFTSTANSNLQLNTDDVHRGRVMSVYTLAFGGTTPIGNLFAGAVTEQYGAQAGTAACGVMVLLLLLALGMWTKISNRKAGTRHA